MSLLEAPLNTNPNAKSGSQLAVVDNSALSTEKDSGEAFIDYGKSGTGQISVYVVRKGDTLSSIAQMFGVSKSTIIWANDIGTTINPGMELVILPISGVRHTVRSGDTVQSIAKKYGADVSDILAYNDLAPSSKLVTGQIVIVPDGEIDSVPSSSGSSGSISGGGILPVGSRLPNYAGYYMRPVDGIKTQGLHGHNGIDIGAPVGTPIWASAAGKVIISKIGGYNGGYGSYIVVSHDNGTQTLYAHLSRNDIAVGDSVVQGQTIGAIGLTGKTTGPHLHFEVRGARNPF
ncbi:M23 family metallopeptidase [Candidatus Parcubacteria bacterium]|nr:M23 family metallopeptidase [Candidatus Parcubacteria bacterium]